MRQSNIFPLKHQLITFFILATVAINAQTKNKPAIESFENKSVLTTFNSDKASKLSLSEAHHKYGTSSLRWDWTAPSSISTQHFKVLPQNESPLKYGDHFPASPTLSMSIYNEVAQDGKIKIAASTDEKDEIYFEIELSFTGWRTIWVPYYEMKGAAPEKTASVDFNTFTISTSTKKGTLFFDDIVFSQYQDDRHSYPDQIVPFIKSDQTPGADHWMPLMQNMELITNITTTPINNTQKQDLVKIEARLDKAMTIDKKYKVYMETMTKAFDKLQLVDNGKTVVGPPMNFKTEQIYFDEHQQGEKLANEVDALGKVLKKLANFHDRATPEDQKEIERMFLLGTRYYLDQGWQAGASGGTRHHVGYNVREITEGFFIMRKTLKKEGLLDEVGSSLHWLFNLGMVLGDETKFHVNIDYLNTQAYYHLMLLFLVDSPEKQAALLNSYSNYISITLGQQKQEWGFKVDGTAWHHNGHYPAYGMGAFRNVPKIIQTLSGTTFRIGEQGHANFKNAFLATRSYSQKLDYGFGNAGRHPLEDNSIKSLKYQYLQMAYSGNPKGTEEIDKEVAAAYLRLWGKSDKLNTETCAEIHDVKAEVLEGYKTFPYAATAIHRRDNWAAIIKGYSKYVWASEIYVASNRYGRYPANGTIQLLNEKGEAASGFKQKGWDWNRYPGATIIYLPLEELEPNTPLLMYRSGETFAGATDLNGNGIFGMVLNESKGSNADGDEVNVGFPGKLKAHKSVFSFGNKLICIGTDISSIDSKNPTQTNLFQSYLKSTNKPIYTDEDGTVTDFPYEDEAGTWLVDPYGNGYAILSDNDVFVSRKTQNSFHNKYSIKTGAMNSKGKGAKETKGRFAAGWIDHGNAPQSAAYQYVVYPNIPKDAYKKFGKIAKKDKSYEILKADSIAHIVLDKETNTTGYVIFEADTQLNTGVISEVSEPALVMISENNKGRLDISIVQPDLNFEAYHANKYINFSRPVPLEVTMKGTFTTTEDNQVKKISYNEGNTTLHLECIDGLPVKLQITKK